MKLTKYARFLALALILTVAATGFRKHPFGVTPLPNQKQQGLTDDKGAGAIKPGEQLTETTGTPLPDPTKYDKYNRDAEILKANTVHFDFDSSVVKSSEKANISAVADHLKGNASAAVEVAGNCDERGTEEYNRALGERRALAVREELLTLGIDGARVVTISYGKDRPVDPAHDESAWKKNRRGDFVLLTPPK